MFARLMTRVMDAQGGWTKPLGNLAYRFLHWFFSRMPAVRDLLIGRWLGHPLHAVLTDAPIGILFLVIVFDVLGSPAAAAWALAVGSLAMVGAALAGFADYADTDGMARVRATLHATIMVVALVGYSLSLLLRFPVDANQPASAAAILISIGSFLIPVGRRLRRRRRGVRPRQHGQPARVPRRGHEVDRAGTRRDRGGRLDPGGQAGEGQARHQPARPRPPGRDDPRPARHVRPRWWAAVRGARSSTETIECPWHATRYGTANGHLVAGPSVYDQPAYEVRAREGGGWEARRQASWAETRAWWLRRGSTEPRAGIHPQSGILSNCRIHAWSC